MLDRALKSAPDRLRRTRRPAIRARSPFAFAALIWAVPAALALASEPEGRPDDPPPVLIDEVVVSAKRSARPINDVPFSVSSVSALDLDEAGVDSTFDLPTLVSGLVFSTETVLGQPYLRGVGSDLLSSAAESSIATYVDEVYRPRPVSSLVNLYDVERVEVLKGPQGTLFGRNATGGVIHVINRRPSPQPGLEGTFLYGSFDEILLRAAANLPVADGRVRLRVSGLGDWRDGYSENLFLAQAIDDLDVGAGRLQAEIDLADGATLLLSGDYLREQDSRGFAQKLVAPLEGSPAVAVFGGTVPADPRQVLFDTAPGARVDDWGLLARLDWRLPLGDLIALSAYRESDFDETLDVDGTQVPLFVSRPRESSQVFTQEVRLVSSAGGRFAWLAGLYYLHEPGVSGNTQSSEILGLEDTTSASLGGDSLAGFGDVSWAFSETLRAAVGLRYTWDRRTEDFFETINGAEVAHFSLDANWNAPTPRVVLEWLPRETVLTYASISRGYQAGGFNSLVAQRFPFGPSFLWAYETGVKASFLDKRLQARIAGYLYDWDDLPLLVVVPEIDPLLPIVTNAATATVKGLDLELDARPTPRLRLSLALTLLDARFDDFEAIDYNDPTASPDQSGKRLPRAPEVSLNAGAEYSVDLGRWGALTPRVDYRFQSRVFYNPFEDPLVSQDAFGILNLLLRWEDRSSHFFVSVLARNATNQLWAQSKIRVDGQIGNNALWGPPHLFGFEIGALL